MSRSWRTQRNDPLSLNSSSPPENLFFQTRQNKLVALFASKANYLARPRCFLLFFVCLWYLCKFHSESFIVRNFYEVHTNSRIHIVVAICFYTHCMFWLLDYTTVNKRKHNAHWMVLHCPVHCPVNSQRLKRFKTLLGHLKRSSLTFIPNGKRRRRWWGGKIAWRTG